MCVCVSVRVRARDWRVRGGGVRPPAGPPAPAPAPAPARAPAPAPTPAPAPALAPAPEKWCPSAAEDRAKGRIARPSRPSKAIARRWQGDGKALARRWQGYAKAVPRLCQGYAKAAPSLLTLQAEGAMRLHRPASTFNLPAYACIYIQSACLRRHLHSICLHLQASACIGLHMPASTSICLHWPASTGICLHRPASSGICLHLPACACICLHTPAYACSPHRRGVCRPRIPSPASLSSHALEVATVKTQSSAPVNGGV